jgi:hypothetical protein
MPQQSSIVATWSEDGNVYIYDVAPALETLNGHPSNAETLETLKALCEC